MFNVSFFSFLFLFSPFLKAYYAWTPIIVSNMFHAVTDVKFYSGASMIFPHCIYSKAICNYGKNYPLTNTQSYVPLKSGICNCSRNCNIKCIAGCKAITSLKTSVAIAVSSCRLLRCFSLTMNSSSDPFRETSQATPLQHKSLYLCPSGGWYIPNTHISD